jgi:hypothetical protein
MIHRFTTSTITRTWNAMEGPNLPDSHKIQSAHHPGIAITSILYSKMKKKMSSVLHLVTQRTINAKASCDNCKTLLAGTDWTVCEVQSLSMTM